METKLLVLKPAKIFGDPNGLANFCFANGRGFPASYRRFATQYGWGRSLGNYLVHIPANPQYCDSWQQARSVVKSTYINDLYEYEGFFSAQHVCLMARMECFAKSETDTYLFWDIESCPSHGIHRLGVGHGGIGVPNVAAVDLREGFPIHDEAT